MPTPPRPVPLTSVGDRLVVAYAASAVLVVGGRDGVLLVDTGEEDSGLTDAVRGLGLGPVVAVALTHGHLEHTGGMAAVRQAWPEATVWAHESAGVTADRTFSSVAAVDLGGRVVELLHPGRGHTGGDVVVHVPEARLVAAGDLVIGDDHEDGGGGAGACGADEHPTELAVTLDVLLGMLAPDARVLTGHGPLLTRDEVLARRWAAAAGGEEGPVPPPRQLPLV
jgi:glyoxylase-like metal-dependent hydrolase (beta-lactamase superfamily II)